MITVKELLQKEPKGANLIDILENSEFETVYTERLDEIKSMSTGQQFIEMQKLIFVFDDVIFNAHEKLIAQTHKHNGNCNSIYDYNDELEVAIKTNLFEGDKVKNFKALCQLIGLEIILHRAELSNMNGRKQRNKIEKVLSQYLIFEREDNKQEITIKTVFDIPDYIDFSSKRGLDGKVRDNAIPLIASSLNKEKEATIIRTTKQLAKIIGCLIYEDEKYIKNKCKYEKDKKPYRLYNMVIAQSRPITNRWVYSALLSLNKDYNAINYYDIIIIKFYDMSKKKSFQKIVTMNENEAKIITFAKAEILKEYNLQRMYYVYQRGKKFTDKFYKRVIEYINNNHNSNNNIYWCDFYYAINIDIVNREQLYKGLANNDSEDLKLLSDNLKNRLSNQLNSRIIKIVNNTNQKALDSVLNNNEIKELYELDVYSDEDLIVISNDFFYLEDNKRKIQQIIKMLIYGDDT